MSDLAHVEMLARQKIIAKADARKIIRGLKQIEREVKSGKFKFKPELEDVHMNLEARLFELAGEVAGKLHTGRSRNDLVVNDERLWLKDELDKLDGLIEDLLKAIVAQAEKHLSVIMPGYTHTRPAQPILFSHWLLAYAEMFMRDHDRLCHVYFRVDLCPLGSGALAGSNYKLDRAFLAKALGFAGVTNNSLDAVSDRDFLIEFVAALAILMSHLSRLGEELVWMSGEEFGYFELPEPLTTGSSIMPNKKNPDAAELVRGKTARVYGHLMALLTLVKGTPLAYNRDFQEDKEAGFDAADTATSSLEIARLLIAGLEPNADRMRRACDKGFILATDLADYLVKKGLGFRQAHFAVGKLVRDCEKKGKRFEQLKLSEFQESSPLFGQDVFKLLSMEASVKSKAVPGGTAPARVKSQIQRLKALLGK
jgi:argininosuccinate lyase